MMKKPLLVGLTGSIGMGKSTVAAMLRQMHVPVFDADAEVHALQGPSGVLVQAIEAAFPGTTGPQGVDRAALGKRVLGDDAALARLEGLIHPAVAEARAAFINRHGDESILVFDIPLLFEKGGDDQVDQVVVVSAPLAVQRARVLARPGMTAEKFEQIRARQIPDEVKRARADHVIDTGVSHDETHAQIATLLACLRAKARA